MKRTSLLLSARPNIYLSSRSLYSSSFASREFWSTSLASPASTSYSRKFATAKVGGPIYTSIQRKLQADFQPIHLDIVNESYKHGVPPDSEHHFHVHPANNLNPKINPAIRLWSSVTSLKGRRSFSDTEWLTRYSKMSSMLVYMRCPSRQIFLKNYHYRANISSGINTRTVGRKWAQGT